LTGVAVGVVTILMSSRFYWLTLVSSADL